MTPPGLEPPQFPDPPTAKPERRAKSYQIVLSDAEKQRLGDRIERDFQDAKSAHQDRSKRFAGYMQRWENRVDPPKKGDEDKPNHTVPLVQWSCFNKLARSL